jgi:hypothetical protein
MELLQAWRAWQPSRAPHVLAGDAGALERWKKKGGTVAVVHEDWRSASRAPDFEATSGDVRLHLGLLPMPFVGDLRNATTFLLLLNPGYGPTDYFGEFEVEEYRGALLDNLAQRRTPGVAPFLFLDPGGRLGPASLVPSGVA